MGEIKIGHPLIKLEEGEKILWSNQITKGIINKTVVETQLITNMAIRQNHDGILPLHLLGDIVIMNKHRQGERQHYSVPLRGTGVRYSISTGSPAITVGDVIFFDNTGQPIVNFRHIQDPQGVKNLVKGLLKSVKKKK
jgi:hypothetical protein